MQKFIPAWQNEHVNYKKQQQQWTMHIQVLVKIMMKSMKPIPGN